MTLHDYDRQERMIVLVHDVETARETRTASYLATRHMVRVSLTIACFGVFVAGILTVVFSG